jgi:hypothetical protein
MEIHVTVVIGFYSAALLLKYDSSCNFKFNVYMCVCLQALMLFLSRNLEFLGIAWKRKGWKFQYPSKEYYHRLEYIILL